MNQDYDAIVVGGGLAGLTAAAFLSRAGKSALLCEQAEKCGGLVNTFEREGFYYDGGIRALENSGVLFPMLRQLGIHLDFVPNVISIGIEDKIIPLKSEDSVEEYQNLLIDLYPESRQDIVAIIGQIRLIMKYMEVQYGIDNPLFLDMKADRDYMMKTILPWMFKYAMIMPKISKITGSTVEFLKKYSNNQNLLDIIAQHFFADTPAYFALSYMKLYLDYYYPKGGTGTIVTKLVDLITENNGTIRNLTEIVELDAGKHTITTARGEVLHYRRLIWAADQQALYRLLKVENIGDVKVRAEIEKRKALISNKAGNDSIFTMYLGLNLGKEYFSNKCTAHLFYTPDRSGSSATGPIPYGQDRQTIEKWMEKLFALTTYEISIPALRDESMAPAGKTGLIVSLLFDYKLVKYIEGQGWYEAFKSQCEQNMIKVLNRTLFPGIEGAVQHVFSSTPVTLQKLTGNHEGAITGWSFTNQPVPAESKLPRIMKAIQTPIPGVYQAGQWTFSPSGLPVSLLTGKIAADRVIKDFKKQGLKR